MEAAGGGSYGSRWCERSERPPDNREQALAERVGIPQTHVSAMELGIQFPNLLTVLRLAVALECKVTDLVRVFDKSA
jgi:DNA-binding Xre family transcriptional regulator